MSEKIRLDRKICFQKTFYTKSINVIIDSIGPSIILRSMTSDLSTSAGIYTAQQKFSTDFNMMSHFE